MERAGRPLFKNGLTCLVISIPKVWLAMKNGDLRHPHILGWFPNWIRLLRRGGGIDRQYIPKAVFVGMVNLLTMPLGLYERMRYQTVLKYQPIDKPPVFIIGHWRSGTSYLLNLMAQDPALGYVTTFQTVAPAWYLSGDRWVKPLLQQVTPEDRVADDMPIDLDGPEEEEYTIHNMLPYSFYTMWTFPRRARAYFEKYVLFRDVPLGVVVHWREAYLAALRKATWKMGGRRLVLKNPTNTGRTGLLRSLFPGAKFIHIYRNPYHVYRSCLKFYANMIAFSQLQDIDPEMVRSNILFFYRELMQKFFDDRAGIPPGNLVDVRYEDLVHDAHGEMCRIYETLALPGFAQAEPHLVEYIAANARHTVPEYRLDAESIALVNQHWGFAVERWGYATLI